MVALKGEKWVHVISMDITILAYIHTTFILLAWIWISVGTLHMFACNCHLCILTKSSDMLNKIMLGVKSARPIRSNIANEKLYVRPKTLISSEAKKLFIKILQSTWMAYSSLQGIFTTMIGIVTWPPYDNVWPSDNANHSCENTL